MRHFRFVSRTVFVKNNNIEKGLQVVNRMMKDGSITAAIRKNREYMKPCEERSLVDRMRAKRIYGEGMSKKVDFLMRKSRTNPHPR